MDDAQDSRRKLVKGQLKKKQRLAKPDVMLVTKNVMIPVLLSPPRDKLFPAQSIAKNKLKMIKVHKARESNLANRDPEKPSVEMRASAPTTKTTHGKPIRNSASTPVPQTYSNQNRTTEKISHLPSSENEETTLPLPCTLSGPAKTHSSVSNTNVQSTINNSSATTKSMTTSNWQKPKSAELKLSIQILTGYNGTTTPSNINSNDNTDNSRLQISKTKIPDVMNLETCPPKIIPPSKLIIEKADSTKLLESNENWSSESKSDNTALNDILLSDLEEVEERNKMTSAFIEESNCSENFGNDSEPKVQNDFDTDNNYCCSERESEIGAFNYTSASTVDRNDVTDDTHVPLSEEETLHRFVLADCTVIDRPGQNTGLVNDPASENLAVPEAPENPDARKQATNCQLKYSWQDLSTWVPPSKKTVDAEDEEQKDKRDHNVENSSGMTNKLECKIAYSWQILGISTQTSSTLSHSSQNEVHCSDKTNRHDCGIYCEAEKPFECKIKYSWQIVGVSAQASLSEDQNPDLSDQEYWKGTLLPPSKNFLESEPGSWRGLSARPHFREGREVEYIILHNENTQTVNVSEKENQTELLDSNGCEIKYSWENLIRRYVKRSKCENGSSLKDGLCEGKMDEAKAMQGCSNDGGNVNGCSLVRAVVEKQSNDTFKVCSDISEENLEIIFEASEDCEAKNEGEDDFGGNMFFETEVCESNIFKEADAKYGDFRSNVKRCSIVGKEVKKNYEALQVPARRDKHVKQNIKTVLEEQFASSLNSLKGTGTEKELKEKLKENTKIKNLDLNTPKEIIRTNSCLKVSDLLESGDKIENVGQKKTSCNVNEGTSRFQADITDFQNIEIPKNNIQKDNAAENTTHQNERIKGNSKSFQESVQKKTPFHLQPERMSNLSIKRCTEETTIINENDVKGLFVKNLNVIKNVTENEFIPGEYHETLECRDSSSCYLFPETHEAASIIAEHKNVPQKIKSKDSFPQIQSLMETLKNSKTNLEVKADYENDEVTDASRSSSTSIARIKQVIDNIGTFVTIQANMMDECLEHPQLQKAAKPLAQIGEVTSNLIQPEINTTDEILGGIFPSMLHDVRNYIMGDISHDDLYDFEDSSISRKSDLISQSKGNLEDSESIESMDPEKLVKRFLSEEVSLLKITDFISNVDPNFKPFSSILKMERTGRPLSMNVDNPLKQNAIPYIIDTMEEIESPSLNEIDVKVENENVKSIKSTEADILFQNEEVPLQKTTVSIALNKNSRHCIIQTLQEAESTFSNGTDSKVQIGNSIRSMVPEHLVNEILLVEAPLLNTKAPIPDDNLHLKLFPPILKSNDIGQPSFFNDGFLCQHSRPYINDELRETEVPFFTETDSKVQIENSIRSIDPDNLVKKFLSEEFPLLATTSITDFNLTLKPDPFSSIPRSKGTRQLALVNFEDPLDGSVNPHIINPLKETQFPSLSATNHSFKIDSTSSISSLKATNFSSKSIIGTCYETCFQSNDRLPNSSALPAVDDGTSIFLSLAGHCHEVIKRSCEDTTEDMDRVVAEPTVSTSGNQYSNSDGCLEETNNKNLLEPRVRVDVCDAAESGDRKTRKKELLSRLESAVAKLKRCERQVEANWSLDDSECNVKETDLSEREDRSEEGAELTEDVNKDIRGIVQSAEEYIAKLEEQLKDLNTADEQIVRCSEKTLNDIDKTYQALIDDVCREINQRRNLVRLETEVYKNEGLAPLKACRQEVNAQIRSTQRLIVLTETILKKPNTFSKERLNRIVTASSNMGRIPAVPMIEELPYVTFSSPSAEVRCEIIERISRLGCVLRMGPAQFTEVLERPACLLVKWHVVDPEYAAEEHTFLVQKADGDVLDPTSTAFKTVYEGPEMSCFVRDLTVDQTISLRVGIQVADTAWSVHRRAKTTIAAYTWDLNNKNYMITNIGKIAAKITDDISTLLSREAQFSADHIIEFKFLEATKGTNNEGVALVFEPKGSDDTLKRNGALLITTQGKIFMDGEEKLMQLPKMRFGTRIIFTAQQKNADTLRMNIECDDKAVTYDWTVQTPLHFAARFTEYNKWNLMVK